MRNTLARWWKVPWTLAGCAGLFAVLVVVLHPAPADAMGVKCACKTTSPRKPVPRSWAPSHVLLVGSPPRRLQRDLSAAGHDVETATTAAAATTRAAYAVVIVDSSDMVADARARFVEAVVIARSGDVSEDLRNVELAVGGQPLRADAVREHVTTPLSCPCCCGPAPAPGSDPTGGGAATFAVLAALGLAVSTLVSGRRAPSRVAISP